MIRMGRGNRPDQPDTPVNNNNTYTTGAQPSYQYQSEAVAAPSRAITDSESMARDIKEGRLSGFVGHGTVLTGETNFEAMLRVDGHLMGTVASDSGTLLVGTNGQVDANISVAAALVNGNVNGDIIATDKIQLGRTARVVGNITTPRLILEDGAVLEGSCSMFVLLPAVGLANAAATLVGQNLGAAKPERAERSVWTAGFLNAGLLGVAGLFFIIFPDLVISIFTQDPAVAAYGRDCLRIVGYGYAFYGLGMVMESSFNGAGDAWTPTYLNFFVFWLIEIPLAYLLATRFAWGPQGVFWAITISFSILAVTSALVFKRGKWKLKTV